MGGLFAAKLFGPLASGGLILLALALAYVTISKNATIGELRGNVAEVTKQRDEARSDLIQCRQNRVTLEGSLQRQSQAVAAARAEGEREVANVRREAERWRREAERARGSAAAILERRGTGDHCADADTLILEELR